MASKLERRRGRPRNLIPREATVKMQLRLPKSQHRELKRAAKRDRTSMHAEILERLRHERLDDRDDQLEWIAKVVKLIWEWVNGEQATQGKAPQNGPTPPQRAPESDHG